MNEKYYSYHLSEGPLGVLSAIMHVVIALRKKNTCGDYQTFF